MKRFVYRYPHCLPEEVQQMTKDEFPGHPQNIWASDLAVCEACKSEIETDVFLVSNNTVYCKLCATKYILPHCTDELLPIKGDVT